MTSTLLNFEFYCNLVGKINARSGNQKRPPAIPFAKPKKLKRVVEVPATLALAATQFLSTCKNNPFLTLPSVSGNVSFSYG